MRHQLIGYVGTKDLITVTEGDIKSLDIINVAFAHVINNEVVWKSEDAREAIARIKEINPNIKVLLSVGGWGSGGFSEAAATVETRKLFISSSINIIKKYGLEGLDLDWEYPSYSIAGIKGSKEDKKNFTKLIMELREAFELEDKNYMLTIAVGAGEYYLKGVELSKIVPYLDYVQLMTYDLRSGYQILTGHHTNLFSPDLDIYSWSVDYTVEVFHAAGLPMEKMVIGVAFYSRMWKGVPNIDKGYIQMAETVGTYGPSYGQLVKGYINKKGYTRYWDEVAKAPYLFNGNTFISYDDEESIRHKIEYMKDKGIHGVMYWEYCCDETYTLTSFMARMIDN